MMKMIQENAKIEHGSTQQFDESQQWKSTHLKNWFGIAWLSEIVVQMPIHMITHSHTQKNPED